MLATITSDIGTQAATGRQEFGLATGKCTRSWANSAASLQDYSCGSSRPAESDRPVGVQRLRLALTHGAHEVHGTIEFLRPLRASLGEGKRLWLIQFPTWANSPARFRIVRAAETVSLNAIGRRAFCGVCGLSSPTELTDTEQIEFLSPLGASVCEGKRLSLIQSPTWANSAASVQDYPFSWTFALVIGDRTSQRVKDLPIDEPTTSVRASRSESSWPSSRALSEITKQRSCAPRSISRR